MNGWIIGTMLTLTEITLMVSDEIFAK